MLKRAEMKPISRPLFALLSALLRPYLKLVYNYSAPKKLPEFPDGPLLFLGSHSSNLDFLFAIPLLRKKRFNAVVASYFYFNERVGRLLNFCRCIRKEQFRTDISSIRDMRAAIKNGGSVLIYPEGEVNGTGRCERPHESIVRLARLLDVPVYAIITHGSYLTRPK